MTPIPSRPTFWNVPVSGQVLIYVLGILSVLLCAWGIVKAVKFIRSGAAAQLKKDVPERMRRLWTEGFVQKRIVRTPVGKAHFALFWGFIFLFFGTSLATIDWDITRLLFGFRILQGDFYLFYKLILDFAGLATLAGLGVAAWSRWIKKSVSLEASPRFAMLIGSLALIIITGFFLEALRLAAQKPAWAGWSFVGNFIATTLFSGVSAEKLETAHLILWWIHGIGSLAFIASIPLNFFSHMFKTPWNIFEQKLEPMGAAPKIDNIEEQETFGISQMKQFTWKDRLDFASCTECARCSAVCPAVKMGTPLDPKNVVLKLQHAFANGGENEPTEKFISEDELWACTTCGACTNACPSRINLPDAIVKMRTHYALEEGKFPPGVAKTLQNIASVGNPWGMDPDSRLDWAEGLDLPIMDPDRPVDILYWVGCSASFDKRSQKIARSMVKILKASGLSFGVMAEERCHADFARRLGEEYLFQTAAAENIANLSQYKFGKILCACPHCFNTLENEYPEFEGGKFEVISHVELIRNLIRDGKLPNLSENDIATTYQDPCYLSRYNGLSSEPREILASMKTDMREPQFCKENTNCCGAGGGQFWSDGSKTQRVNVIRFNELKDTGAKQLATACPFCLSMMESAKAKEKDETIQVKDIAEVVAEHLA
ncbi:(Fe-S)-binding protein [Mesosutterella multiformis]|jgi:Fe-S oxidoreductase|uniref:4Fe-4S ferredoxin-type domain-containing protein n=1 Tax=Mesosutterella multiformis TaxID=2259133 RepID=A0A388SDS6_9BURK|nr:(Fe-S)-binding protein [Mesosutterella multiformis]MBS5811793.1 (Fe-S)-binding protein [Sutterella sp.]MCH3936056.1 4Fe-4S dicluster domain-containing protein [Mesosutterella sp.]MBM6983373.1 (Fe-S)-binding protein [Mesosutterella multiformis]MCH3937034.1 4Fe-4S dicluster domain-containing protein [Mesosutterella sp.]GBO93590.1 hypothetical protein MESMUL_09440 [Mesosutterella multiformis]